MLAQPQDFGQAFVDAWMARDGAALAALFAEDADFVNVVGLWWEDRAAIAKAHDYALKSFFSRSTLVLGKAKLRPLGDDVVLVHQRFILTGQLSPTGTETGRRATLMSVVLERRGGGWLAVSAHNTDIVPGAETHVATAAGLNTADYRAE
ncbi:SgcJ/EcaC family oxidoreductase [Actibacterium lipolyticum]|uniref:SnoaL-like domain protein n=1 Tax=Actibacterium lipolyticum TaxID=1524263 RepID=A0A238JT80_9RHOB|nr:SgcJ/EcaC family oxidoreductase [Actibacterium lipolyticum]SMX33869.1 SnoaL-like domain protein [Actibacterium lipolyticum]